MRPYVEMSDFQSQRPRGDTNMTVRDLYVSFLDDLILLVIIGVAASTVMVLA